jgi:hypothetical protein
VAAAGWAADEGVGGGAGSATGEAVRGQEASREATRGGCPGVRVATGGGGEGGIGLAVGWVVSRGGVGGGGSGHADPAFK